MKDIELNNKICEYLYIEQHFIEIEICCAPERTYICLDIMQGKRKQYELRQYVTSTIHTVMDDTPGKVTIKIASNGANFKMWDKSQIVILLS